MKLLIDFIIYSIMVLLVKNKTTIPRVHTKKRLDVRMAGGLVERC